MRRGLRETWSTQEIAEANNADRGQESPRAIRYICHSIANTKQETIVATPSRRTRGGTKQITNFAPPVTGSTLSLIQSYASRMSRINAACWISTLRTTQ